MQFTFCFNRNFIKDSLLPQICQYLGLKRTFDYFKANFGVIRKAYLLPRVFSPRVCLSLAILCTEVAQSLNLLFCALFLQYWEIHWFSFLITVEEVSQYFNHHFPNFILSYLNYCKSRSFSRIYLNHPCLTLRYLLLYYPHSKILSSISGKIADYFFSCEKSFHLSQLTYHFNFLRRWTRD